MHLHIKRIVSESEDTLKASTVCLDHYQTVFGTLENFSFVHFLNPTPDGTTDFKSFLEIHALKRIPPG